MTRNYITIQEFNAYKSEVENCRDYKKRREMEKQLGEMYKVLLPEVGMGATIVLYSDTEAATITRVISPNKIEVMHNKVVCKDWYNSSYDILPELDTRFKVETYSRRKSGRWIEVGQPDKYGSVKLRIGQRHHYIDPSF